MANGFGLIRVAAGSGPPAYLPNATGPGADLRLAFQLDKQPTGSGLYLSTFGRRVTNAGSYTGKVRITSTGSVALELVRTPATGSEVSLQGAVVIPGLTHVVGDTLNLRLEVTGTAPTTIRAKIWKTGTQEPTSWQRSVTDNTANMQGAGSVGLSPYLSSSANNAPITVKVDELSVAAP